MTTTSSPKKGKGRITFHLPHDHPTNNKITMRWKQRLTNREQANANRAALHVSAETTYRFTPAQCTAITSTKSIVHVGRTYLHNNNTQCHGVLNGSILSTAADSGATSSVGTKADICHFIRTGHQSDKIFRMPNGTTKHTSKIGHLATPVCSPAHDIHITPGIMETSLISTVKFAEAGYVTIFDQDQVNIYDQHNTIITVLQAAILRSWREPGTNDLWRIPLVPVISNQNTNTVIVAHPPSKYLPKRSSPTEAIFNL
jgi:hypothetical protein